MTHLLMACSEVLYLNNNSIGRMNAATQIDSNSYSLHQVSDLSSTACPPTPLQFSGLSIAIQYSSLVGAFNFTQEQIYVGH